MSTTTTPNTTTNTAGDHVRVDSRDAVAMLEAATDLLGRIRFELMHDDEVDPIRRAIARTRGRLDVVQSDYLLRLQALNDEGRCADPESKLGGQGGMSGADAAKATRHAELLGRFPAMRRALGDGLISSGHVDALAGIWRQLDSSDRAALEADDATLAIQAQGQSVEDFRRRLWKRKDRNDTRKGMTEAEKQQRRNKLTGGLDPATTRYQYFIDLERELGARFEQAISDEVDRMVRNNELEDLHPDLVTQQSHLRAYALHRLIARGHRFVDAPVDGDDPRPSGNVDLGVIIDAKTLAVGPARPLGL